MFCIVQKEYSSGWNFVLLPLKLLPISASFKPFSSYITVSWCMSGIFADDISGKKNLQFLIQDVIVTLRTVYWLCHDYSRCLSNHIIVR